MTMIRNLLLSLGLVGLFISDFEGARAQTPAPAPACVVTVRTDRPDGTYKINEPVTFDVTITQGGVPVKEGTINWSLTQDGVPPMDHGTSVIKDEHASVTGKLAAPGFLQCKVSFKTDTGDARGIGGAAVDPLDIKPSLPVPDDFDAFWEAQKLRLKAVPMNAKMTPVPTKVAGIELFDVQADAVGDKPMRGLYARPIGAKPKSLPAIITLEGAGVYSTRLEPWLTSMAKDGFISLEVNAHGLPNGLPAEDYLALEKGSMKDYQFMGRESRETSYFLNMYLRDIRGIDFLTSQPEWDGRVLIANGTSQGGAQSIFLAAEDPRVTFLTAVVPAMCDHTGFLVGRVPGWPRMVPNGADGKPDAAILEASRYFDGMNFATRVKVPSVFVAGFLDQITPPTSVYAAYNNVPGQKEMIPAVNSPHRVEPQVMQEVRDRVLKQKTSAPGN